eukprot:7852123-Pyramimonas_sp.AAC.1
MNTHETSVAALNLEIQSINRAHAPNMVLGRVPAILELPIKMVRSTGDRDGEQEYSLFQRGPKHLPILFNRQM